MPKYFFDFQDDVNLCRDDEGIEFSDPATACQQMRSTLLDMGRDILRIGAQRQIVGVIRDEQGVLWRGQLSLQVGWSSPPAAQMTCPAATK